MPLNATFNPSNRQEQRVLNYSAIFDEVEDFEANVRNVSGPGPLAAAVPCNAPPPPPQTSTNDPNHGILFGDNGDVNLAPCIINNLARPNAGRQQHTVSLPGSSVAVPAHDALREWLRVAVRTPNRALLRSVAQGRPGDTGDQVSRGSQLFASAGCTSCHGTSLWTSSRKDFVSPPAVAEVFTETTPAPVAGRTPIGVSYINRFLRNIGSFGLGVPGANNDIGGNVGADEKTTAGLTRNAAGALVAGARPDALGLDHNNDGRGNGFSPPSLLGISPQPPYYHNGACETLDCVLGNAKHRTANGTLPDRLTNPADQRAVVAFLRSIDSRTPALP